MRAKIVLPIFVLALVILAAAIVIRNKSTSAPAVQPVAGQDDTNAASVPQILKRIAMAPQAQGSVSGNGDAATDLNSPEHEQYANERKAELYQMGLNQDPATLPTILAEVHNPDPQIRSAALTATMDFGSKDAIPTLKNELSWAEDPQEKVEIQKAIAFLELPPFELDQNGALVQQPASQPDANN